MEAPCHTVEVVLVADFKESSVIPPDGHVISLRQDTNITNWKTVEIIQHFVGMWIFAVTFQKRDNNVFCMKYDMIMVRWWSLLHCVIFHASQGDVWTCIVSDWNPWYIYCRHVVRTGSKIARHSILVCYIAQGKNIPGTRHSCLWLVVAEFIQNATPVTTYTCHCKVPVVHTTYTRFERNHRLII